MKTAWRKCAHPRTPENTISATSSRPGGQCRTCFAAVQRRAQLKFLYGLSEAEYDALVVDQGGVCAVCKRLPAPGKRLVVDHAHVGDTPRRGEPRALLCVACNTALGLVGEDYERLSALQAYLNSHRPREVPCGA